MQLHDECCRPSYDSWGSESRTKRPSLWTNELHHASPSDGAPEDPSGARPGSHDPAGDVPDADVDLDADDHDLVLDADAAPVSDVDLDVVPVLDADPDAVLV